MSAKNTHAQGHVRKPQAQKINYEMIYINTKIKNKKYSSSAPSPLACSRLRGYHYESNNLQIGSSTIK